MSTRLVEVATNEVVELLLDRILMGRRKDCDIILRRPLVSAHHCVLHRNNDDGCWYVQDLDSTNGTWVNGQQVTESPLSSGDYIGLGKNLRFRFECLE